MNRPVLPLNQAKVKYFKICHTTIPLEIKPMI
jgi:hypothetical protein